MAMEKGRRAKVRQDWEGRGFHSDPPENSVSASTMFDDKRRRLGSMPRSLRDVRLRMKTGVLRYFSSRDLGSHHCRLRHSVRERSRRGLTSVVQHPQGFISGILSGTLELRSCTVPSSPRLSPCSPIGGVVAAGTVFLAFQVHSRFTLRMSEGDGEFVCCPMTSATL